MDCDANSLFSPVAVFLHFLSNHPSRHLLPCLSLLPVIVMINARKPFGKNATEFPATYSLSEPCHSPVFGVVQALFSTKWDDYGCFQEGSAKIFLFHLTMEDWYAEVRRRSRHQVCTFLILSRVARVHGRRLPGIITLHNRH